MGRKKKGVASTDAKTYKAMERHSTKLYEPEVDSSGNVKSLRLRKCVTFEEKVRVEMERGTQTPTHRDEAGYWVYEHRQFSREEAIARFFGGKDESELPKPAA